MAQRAVKKKKKSSPLLGLVLLALLIAAGVQLYRMQGQLEKAQADRDAMEAKVESQQQINAALSSDLSKASDPDFLTDLAREQLGLVTSGEKVFYDSGN